MIFSFFLKMSASCGMVSSKNLILNKINQLAEGRISIDLRFDAGGVKIPGGHG